MWSRLTTILLTCALALSMTGIATAATDDETGHVTVVHGLRGLLADLYLDGELILEGFQAERTTDPMPIPAGEHEIDIREAGAPADSPPALSGTITVRPGANISAVAHLSPEGQPTLSVFNNDTARIEPGNARVVVRHTAQAPPIDVTVGDEPFVTDLDPTAQSGGTLPATTYAVTVASATNDETLVPQNQIEFAEGTSYLLYLIGSAENDSVGWLAQTIDGLQSNPANVPTGTDGLAAPRAFPAVALGLLLMLALVSAPFAVRRRNR